MMPRHERDAERTDRYLERLLGSLPVNLADEEPAQPLRDAARLIQRTLVRSHPSFRFEERLAARLEMEARAPGSTRPDDAPGQLIAFRGLTGDQIRGDRPERRARGYLLGGAIASGVSIASIAGVLAWRRARAAAATSVSLRVERPA